MIGKFKEPILNNINEKETLKTEQQAKEKSKIFGDFSTSIEALNIEIKLVEDEIKEKYREIDRIQELVSIFTQGGDEIDEKVKPYIDKFEDDYLKESINEICFIHKDTNGEIKINQLKLLIKDIKKIISILHSEIREIEDNKTLYIKSN